VRVVRVSDAGVVRVMKELWIAAHEELITEYLEAHPEATEAEAERATEDAAYTRMQSKYEDMIDRAWQAHKDGVYQ